jgi:hypothetical protein
MKIMGLHPVVANPVASGASAVSRVSTAEKTAEGINKRESTILPEYCLSTVRFQQENNFLHLLSTRNLNVRVYSGSVFVLLFQKSNERKALRTESLMETLFKENSY